MTQRIVINTVHGGFSLSDSALALFRKLENIAPNKEIYNWDIARDNPNLVRAVEELGQAANGPFAALKIVEIPDTVNWYIEEYDGREWIAERHRTWD